MKVPGALVVTMALGIGGCASLKAPSMQLEHLRVARTNITGMKLDVRFQVRNPNPEPLRVQNFEYELKLNGRRLGRGYHSESFDLEGFASRSVETTFDLNFLSVPSGVKEVLERDRVQAEVKGNFFIRQDDSADLRRLGFKSKAEVRLNR